MKTISEWTRWTVGTCAVASLLAGCGAPPVQPALPLTSAQSAPNTSTPDGWGSHKGSWMDPQAKRDDLVYVSETLGNDVSVYALGTHKLVGMLAGINQPYGLCADKSGDVWIVSWGKNQIFEYAHAGTQPLQILKDWDWRAHLYDCSVDPTTGNLAVTNWGNGWDKGDVLIYPPDGWGSKPKVYSGAGLWFYYGCTYDNKGDLFANGWDAYLNDVFSLSELPKGASQFTRLIVLPNINPELLEGVEWDGEHIAIGDSGFLYQYKIQGKYAFGVGLTFLTFRSPVGMFWITSLDGKRTVVAPDFAGSPNAVQYWNYPAGGEPTATTTAALDAPFGVTVSKASP